MISSFQVLNARRWLNIQVFILTHKSFDSQHDGLWWEWFGSVNRNKGKNTKRYDCLQQRIIWEIYQTFSRMQNKKNKKDIHKFTLCSQSVYHFWGLSTVAPVTGLSASVRNEEGAQFPAGPGKMNPLTSQGKQRFSKKNPSSVLIKHCGSSPT